MIVIVVIVAFLIIGRTISVAYNSSRRWRHGHLSPHIDHFIVAIVGAVLVVGIMAVITLVWGSR